MTDRRNNEDWYFRRQKVMKSFLLFYVATNLFCLNYIRKVHPIWTSIYFLNETKIRILLPSVLSKDEVVHSDILFQFWNRTGFLTQI